MNGTRLSGIVLLVLGFGIAVIAGLWLATGVSNGDLETGGMLVGAFLVFIPVALFVGFGLYLYQQGGKEEARESVMHKQIQLLDIIQSRGQVKIHDVAIEMGVNVDDLQRMIHDLVGLQVFSGYINWDEGTLYSTDASQLKELTACRNCGGEITLAGKGVATCRFCGTEYYLS
ncbi:MAG: hypothetical protein D6712_13360 [Chloroflexi bacterium]|nr:MAG: hypothetical protein D6712_13360 [Chloroflexota bacterium]